MRHLPTGALACALACALPLAACRAGHDCALDDEAQGLAGRGAIFCGHVPAAGNPATANSCLESAYHDAKPFWVRFDLEAAGGTLSDAIVRRQDGSVLLLRYDGSPCGGPVCSARITQTTCPNPTVDIGNKAPVTCSPPGDTRVICE